MRSTQMILAATMSAGLEMAGFVPFQPPTTPPNPTPRQNPTPLPTPQHPQSQPPAAQPTPQVPTHIDPNTTNPNQTNPTTTTTNPNSTTSAAALRAARPFAFQSPQAEARFNETTKRLSQMETRLDQSNQDLLRRLGEARQLSGERQNAALMDVLQQLLRNNADMQRYLVQARMGWTGGADAQNGQGTETDTLPGTTPGSTLPGTTPGSTLPGTTPGSSLPGTTPTLPGTTTPSTTPPR